MQTAQSGNEANGIGKYVAAKIAEWLGTRLESPNSNECRFRDLRCVIKTARKNNGLFGITKTMQGQLDAVILAVEYEAWDFNVYLIPMEALVSHCTNTGENSGKGKVYSYFVKEAVTLGQFVGHVRIDEPDL